MAIEDFTTWTEGDPESRLTVASDTITINDLYRDEDGTWVYKDYGAAYFNSDFTFRMKFTTPADDTQINASAIIYPLMLSNTVDEPDAIDAANGDYQGFTFQRVVNSLRLYLTICENGTLAQSAVSSLDYNTTYYITLTRDDDGGANSTGQLQLEVYTTNYSGEAGAVEEDTVTVDCGAGEQNDFRYVVLAVPEGWSGGFNYHTDGVIEDFDPDPTGTSHVELAGIINAVSTMSGGLSISTARELAGIVAAATSVSGALAVSGFPSGSFDATGKIKHRLVAVGNNSLYYEDV